MKSGAKQAYAAPRSMALLTVLSILSPISGLAMEMTLAWRYGASGTVDAFRVSALLGSLGLALFFGYLLPHIVVPLFAQYRAEGREEEGWRLATGMALAISAVSLPLVAWVWLWPDALTELFGPGLPEAGRDEAAWLIRCFALVFLLMAWSGVIGGLLQAYRLFWPSALAQLLPNLSLVLAVGLAGRGAGVGPLMLGILSGNAAMLLILLYMLLRVARSASIHLSVCLKPASADSLRKALAMSLPLLAAILLSQWGSIVINRALSSMPGGTLAEFGYAWKLLTLVGLLPAALATIVFPAFADAHAGRDNVEMSRLTGRAFRMTLMLSLPVTVFLLVEYRAVVELVFGRGGMDAAALAETGQLFAILLVGAPAGVLAGALGKIAYSMHEPASPAWVALFSAIAISLLVPPAADFAGATGVMWMFSLVSWLGMLGLLIYQIRRYRLIAGWEAARYAVLLLFLSAAAAVPALAIRQALDADTTVSFALELALSATIFAFAVHGLSRLARIGETSELWDYAKWQLGQFIARRA